MRRYRIRRRTREGFTLMELLIVLGILVMLIALAAPRLLGTKKKANLKTAASQIGLLRGALEHYALDTEGFPTTEQGLEALLRAPADSEEGAATNWGGPYLNKDLPKDPWGNDYQYAYPPERGSGDFPDIWSLGPDGEDNTEDDICSWTASKEGEGEGEGLGEDEFGGKREDTKIDVDVGSDVGDTTKP